MKRKITYILSLLMIVCMLGACGSDNSKTTYGRYTEDELKEEAQTSLTNIQNYLQIVNSYDDYDGLTLLMSTVTWQILQKARILQ